jgi:hypothetical protein
MNTEITDNIRLSSVNRLLHIDNKWLQSELVEAERTIEKMQAMIDTLAEALENAEPLAISWAHYYAGAPQYGSGQVHETHAAILKQISKAIEAVKGESK